MYGGRFKSPGGVIVKRGLVVSSVATLSFDEVLAAGIDASVEVIGCIVAVMSVECTTDIIGCMVADEVVWMSIVVCLLVSVLTEGSPLSVDCSIVVVDVGVVCCSVASVLVATGVG